MRFVKEEKNNFLLDRRGIAFPQIADAQKVKILNEAAHWCETGSGCNQDKPVDGGQTCRGEVSGVVAD